MEEPRDLQRTHIVFDLGSGRILDESKKDIPIHPASLTKLMTFSIALDRIKAGHLKEDDIIRLSARAQKIRPPKTRLTEVTALEAIRVGMPISFNDLAVALAEHIAHTEWHFCHEYMNPKARALGMKKTEFWNASGLVPRDLPYTGYMHANVTTANDLRLLVSHIAKNHPELFAFSNQREIFIGDRRHKNTNPLLSAKDMDIDGLKTGTLECAGYHLIATSRQNGRHIAAVTLGNYYAEQRCDHAKALLAEGHKILSASLKDEMALGVK
ncbi:MAG TPA: hypothetical protein PLF01_02665 [Alphaproteobacteria bacterium]|nr:hypothetical protein [Alphaproteobacteria bacterium]